MRLLLWFLLLLVSIRAAWATPAATVEAVRAPAWMEHQGAWAPLRPGRELEAGDRIRTGPGGRVMLVLAEGSELRVGAEAGFVLVKLNPPTESDGAFSGLLKIVRGAFRFTTTHRSQAHRRRLDIQIASVNAGISGTDVWGKAAEDRDIVCLIEGRVTVTHESDQPVTLDQPLSFFVAPRQASPQPVTSVGPEQLEKWITQVALEAGTGVISSGPWKVALSSFRREERAERARVALHDAGIPAEIVQVTVRATQWYRLVVSGFENRSEAKAFSLQTRDLAGAVGAWVYRL